MNFLAFILVVFAGVVGLIQVVQSKAKDFVGWALLALSVGLIVQLCTTWSHSIHT